MMGRTMLIKSTLIAAATAIAFSGAAIADGAKGPRVMTDKEMGAIVAGESLFIYATGTPSVPGLSYTISETFVSESVYQTSEFNANEAITFNLDVGWPLAENGLSNADTRNDVVQFR
jgi:hypothetical protein